MSTVSEGIAPAQELTMNGELLMLLLILLLAYLTAITVITTMSPRMMVAVH